MIQLRACNVLLVVRFAEDQHGARLEDGAGGDGGLSEDAAAFRCVQTQDKSWMACQGYVDA